MNRQRSAKNKRYTSPKILLIGDYEGLNDVVNKLNITKDIKQFDKTKKLSEYKDRDIILVKLSRNEGEMKECLGRLEKKYPRIPIVLIISPGQKEKDSVLMIQEFGLFTSWRQNGENINELKDLVNKAWEVSNTITTERNFGHKLKELVVPPAISFLVVFVFWELVILVFSPEGYNLPSPHRVAVEIYRMRENLLWNTLWTALSAFCGLVLAFIVGVLSAILFFYYKKIDRAIMPYFIAIKATPIIALAPLIIRLFPGEFIQLVVMASLISFFPIVVSFVGGLRSVNPEAEEFMTVLQASATKKFFKLYLPHALPQLFSGLKVSSTLSVVGAVVAEFTASSGKGVGYLIIDSTYRGQYPYVFACVFAASLTGIAFYFAIIGIEKFFSPYRHSS